MRVKNILSTTEYEKIIFIWEQSVRATHHFLSDDDILEIKADVIKYLPRLKVYAYKNASGEMLGFIAIDKNKIEMLFVSPVYFGKGIGGALVDFALKDMHVNEVDVNEQNANAREFYEHMGFKVTAHSNKDAQERPFALLHMKRI